MMKPVGFTLLAVLLVFLVLETALRLVGFRYDTRIAYFRFPFPNDEQLHSVFEPDPVLFWRLKPGYSFGGVLGEVNDLGYRGTAYPPRKPAGVVRIVCLGDSVTFGTEHAYPAMMEAMLRREHPDRAWEVINAGTPGYSSLQGVRLLRERYLAYEPDIVTILFGWNDHWLSGGYADTAQRLPTGAAAAVQRALKPLRLYQGLTALIVAARDLTDARGEGDAIPPVRVPLPDYRDNLRAMLALAREYGATPMLLTAPSALHMGIVPDYIVDLGFIERAPNATAADTLARLRGLHAAYNQVARQVAIEEGVYLLDLDQLFAANASFGGDPLFDHPERDIIHPNAEGYELIAEEAAATIADMYPSNNQGQEDSPEP